VVPASAPGIGLIYTPCYCTVVVTFISAASAYVVISLLVVLYYRHGGVRVDCVPSELAAMFLSLRSIYLTPNPNPLHIQLNRQLKCPSCGFSTSSGAFN